MKLGAWVAMGGMLIFGFGATACGFNAGAERILGPERERAQVGMSMAEIQALLGPPTGQHARQDAGEARQLVSRHFTEVSELSPGVYTVWHYTARSSTQHRHVTFRYDTVDIHHCYFVFDESRRVTYKRC